MTPSFKAESDPQTDSSQPKVLAATAGQLLREARLKAGVHLAVLSVTLKVPVRQLEAMEADEFDPGKGPVFYRGLASSVCRHLHVDPAPILALLPQMASHLEPLRSSIQPLATEGTGVIARLPWRQMASSKVIWSAAFMLFLTGALLWLPGPSHWTWLEEVKSLMAEEVVTKEVTEPIVVASVPVSGATAPSLEASAVTAAQSSAAAASTVTTAETTTLVTAPVAPTSPQATPAVPAAALPAPAADPSVSPEWVFSASGESWLEVRNAQKTVLWSGVLKAGESTRIQSPLPVSVVVGRAQVVTATLRGKPFDLKPHTQVTVARFEVKE